MYGLFSKYSFVAYALLPVVLILFRIPLFKSPEVALTSYDADLYTPLWNMLFGGVMAGSVLSIALVLVINFLTCLLVNYITNNFGFTERPTLLGGLFYIMLSSGFVVSQGFYPVSIFALLFVLALMRLFKGALLNIKEQYCFESAMIFAIGSLIWAKGFWFLIFHIVMLIMLRMCTLRTLMATVLGLLTPTALFATGLYLNGTLQISVIEYARCLIVPVAFYKTGIFAKIYLSVMALVLIVSMLHILNKMSTQKILESRYSKIMIWSVFFSVVLLMLPHFSFEIQHIIAVCGAAMLSSFVYGVRSKLISEIITTAMALLVWSVQWWS